MRCLLAWELGSNYGHLVVLQALARELKRQGHDCVFAVRELGTAQGFLDGRLGPLVQAPLRLSPARNAVRALVSYASLLHNVGCSDPLELAGRLQAWRTLYRALNTEFVFADHSPIALIAARTLGIPAANTGNGYTLPPVQAPFPAFRSHPKVPHAVLMHNERTVLAEINSALGRLGLKPLPVLQDIFRGVHPGLLSYDALDPYEAARSETFRGLPDYAYGVPPRWPEGAGPRVFAYVRPNPALPRLMRSLNKRKARVLVRCAPAARDAVLRHAGRNAIVLDRPVNFRLAAERCDAFVNYGAHSTVAEFLLAGKPGLLLPDLQERALTARRAATLGAVRVVRDGAAVDDALDEILDDGPVRRAAEAFALRHAPQDRRAILPAFVREAL
jgi:UDP:flavonoid glycosyltransferase YjiC (YdhE family)